MIGERSSGGRADFTVTPLGAIGSAITRYFERIGSRNPGQCDDGVRQNGKSFP